ncbi:hypothetical protein VDGD_01492 [Verticillium dahliae]|nr:hypothetical protein VDGD_01492 [Verticillium dahliae]
MDTPPPPAEAVASSTTMANDGVPSHKRSDSFSSQKSTDSQTAAEFIREQMQLEADAREALPYSIEHCTKVLGPLRQSVFACLTCTPAPKNPADPFSPAGVCYSCSVQCHGEHTLVEIFTKRNFTCDCGTTRLPKTNPCSLRINPATNTKGGVHSEEPDVNNRYNQNFRNRFCGCECDYDPFQQKGTMFQCLGLGTTETGGCGEDWYHPGCLVGMGPACFEAMKETQETKGGGVAKPKDQAAEAGSLPTITEDAEERPNGAAAAANEASAEAGDDEDEDPPLPPGFPAEDDFEGFLCYKCVGAHPWIGKYAGTKGFLPAVLARQKKTVEMPSAEETNGTSNKRKAEDELEDESQSKRAKSELHPTSEHSTDKPAPEAPSQAAPAPDAEPAAAECKWSALPAPPAEAFSLFFAETFRENLCRCSRCYVGKLNAHPQLLEEEETYEPPLSDGGGSDNGGGSTNGSGSLLERGESALRNVDRVRAIEGVMAYNHLKEQLTPFFKQFAESGQAIGAEDIKAYFAKLRGDEQGIKEAGEAAGGRGKDGDDGSRREQSGY